MQRTRLRSHAFFMASTLASVLLLASCGGGGDSDSGSGHPNSFSVFAERCDAPTQKQFIRAYMNDAYLWPNEIPAVDPAPFTPSDFFKKLLVTTPDSHGLPKDRFSFIVSKDVAEGLINGSSFGYGVDWAKDAQGRTLARTISPGSPADLAGMSRGGELVSVTSSTHESWYPGVAGATTTFIYHPVGGATDRTINLASVKIPSNPIPLATTLQSPNGRRVGYVLFNSHTTGAQDKLIASLSTFASSGIQDLVLDMRYNGGGLLYTARSLASMVTGAANDGKVFEHTQYSSTRTAAGDGRTYSFSGKVENGETAYPAGTALPRLSLKRVYILTSESTCSASESVINSLRGIDVDVVLVGGTTCGKPYGFTQKNNCGQALFPIEFQGTNAKGFGDYSAGFAATCAAADDFSHAQGDPAEGMLGVALRHADQGVCTPSTVQTRAKTSASNLTSPPGLTLDIKPIMPGRLVDAH